MQIYQLHSLIDIERYQRINVLATSPRTGGGAAGAIARRQQPRLSAQCIKRFALIEFIDKRSERCYLAISPRQLRVCESLVRGGWRD